MANDTPEKVDFRIRYWFLADGMFQATGMDDIWLYRLPDQAQGMAGYATKEFAGMVAAVGRAALGPREGATVSQRSDISSY